MVLIKSIRLAHIYKTKIFLKILKKFKFTSKIIPNSKWVSLEFCQNKLDEHFKILNIDQRAETLLFNDIEIFVFGNLELRYLKI